MPESVVVRGRSRSLIPMRFPPKGGLKRHEHKSAPHRLPRGVAGCPQGAAGQGEGADPRPRRAQRRAAPAADGRDRQGLPLRGPGRARSACSTCSRAAASSSSATSCSTPSGTTAARAARPAPTRSSAGLLAHLHARDTTIAYVSRAPLEKHRATTRRAKGWTFPWYSSLRQRLQLRLRRHARRAGGRRSSTTTAPEEPTEVRGRRAAGDARPELLPARRRPGLPHLLDVRPRGRADRRLATTFST